MKPLSAGKTVSLELVVANCIDFLKMSGLKISILKHGEYMVIEEGALHCVLTVGTAGSHLNVYSI